MSDYNDSEDMHGTTLESEYDSVFDGEERAAHLLKITSDKYVRKQDVVKLSHIGLTQPVKDGRAESLTGLSQSIKEMGVVHPIDVLYVGKENETDDYKYVLIDGLRRMYGATKNNIKEVDAIIWEFEDQEQGMKMVLPLSLMLNRAERRTWGEIWKLYRILELQSAITPGTLEYLFQLNGGDAMKLKDVMLCDYSEVKETLLSGQKDLDACYKMLQKLRKEENKLEKEDAIGFSSTVEGADEITSDNTGEEGELSEQDVLELLELAGDMDNLGDVNADDFDELNKGDDSYTDAQKVGERHPLDPDLRAAVLRRDKFKCTCCGLDMSAGRLGVAAVHHILAVHLGGKDTLDNLTTLCLNCHITTHIAERSGGRLAMSKEEFDSLPEDQQESLKKILKLAKVLVEGAKRKGLSKEKVKELTSSAIRHPMPGAGLKDNEKAYEQYKSED